jgi:hypothetical protein
MSTRNRRTALGFGLESTAGTAVSRTNWLAVLDAPIQVEHEWVEEQVLGWSGDVGHVAAAHHKASSKINGTFQVELSYDDTSVMLGAHALGVTGTSGAGPYTHAITLGNQPVALTIEKVLGDSGNSELFAGCRINTYELSVETGGVMTCTVGVIGMIATYPSAGTPTMFQGRKRVIHAHAGTLSFNSVNYTLMSLNLSVTRNLQETPTLGSYTTGQPIADKTDVTLTVRARGLYSALRTAWSAGTQSDAQITFTSGSDTFTIKLSQAQIRSLTDGATGTPLHETEVVFVPNSDGTDLGLVLTWVNGNANATDNS